MSLLLAEDGSYLLTETGSQHLLIEPISSANVAFPFRFMGTAVIIKKGSFWEVDLGRGPIKSENPDLLARAARKSGASGVIYD